MAKFEPKIYLEKKGNDKDSYYYFVLNATLFDKDKRFRWRIKDHLGNNLQIPCRFIEETTPIKFKKRLPIKELYYQDVINSIEVRISEVKAAFMKVLLYCKNIGILDNDVFEGRFLSELGLSNLIKRKKGIQTSTVVEYIELCIEKTKKENTAKQWRTVKNIIRYTTPKLTFDEINDDFREKFKKVLLSELKEEGADGSIVWQKQVYKLSSANKIIKTLNGFIGKSFDEKVHNNEYRIPILNKDLDDIEEVSGTKTKLYLTEKQIRLIYEHQTNDEELNIIKDLFLCMCYTGMRVSDVVKITSEHITYNQNGKLCITKKAHKTGKEFGVPCVYEELNEICQKYNGFPKLHRRTTNIDVVLNEQIKLICKQIPEFGKEYTYKEDVGGGVIETKKSPIFQLITNHTARRSFISNNKDRYTIDEMKMFTGLSSDILVEFYDKRDIVTKLNNYK